MVKPSGAQRKSDGVVVLPGGGKGPDFDHAGDGGKRKGMAGTARLNHPHRRLPAANVRRLQNRLWAAAKQSPSRHFHALHVRIHRPDVLWEAWERVRANRGACRVDRLILEAVQDYGVHRMLGELAADLRAGRYRPSPVRRVEIPKPDGRTRPLGIPPGAIEWASRQRSSSSSPSSRPTSRPAARVPAQALGHRRPGSHPHIVPKGTDLRR